MKYEIEIRDTQDGKDDVLSVTVADMERREVIRFLSPPVRLENITKRNMAVAKTLQAIGTLILKQEKKPLCAG